MSLVDRYQDELKTYTDVKDRLAVTTDRDQWLVIADQWLGDLIVRYPLNLSAMSEDDIKTGKNKTNDFFKIKKENWETDLKSFFEQPDVPEFLIPMILAKIAVSIDRLPFDTVKMRNFDHFALLYKEFILG